MRQPLKWARDAAAAGERRRVFCASLADVLEDVGFTPKTWPRGWSREQIARAEEHVRFTSEKVDARRAELWDLIRETANRCAAEEDKVSPCDAHGTAVDDGDGECAACGGKVGGLDWLLLTKRPERWELIPEDVRPLVWLGTSISDQATADEWVPRLLGAEGFRLRFLSVEPLLGPIDLRRHIALFREGARIVRETAHEMFVERGISWVIVGGESGPGARPCAEEWIASVVTQCRNARVPCFVKQMGAYVVSEERTAEASLMSNPHLLSKWHYAPNGEVWAWRAGLTDAKGADVSQFPDLLSIRQFPEGTNR